MNLTTLARRLAPFVLFPLVACLDDHRGRVASPPRSESGTKVERAAPVAPDEPIAPPVEPIAPPDEPVAPPDEPIAPPDEPIAPPDEPVAPNPRCDARGLTWHLQATDEELGIQRVGCWDGCDAYDGDTACRESRPLLCIHEGPFEDPRDPATVPYSEYWAPGLIRLAPPITGCALPSLRAADDYCLKSFGKGWRMAEFHDGWGWHFWAFGELDIDSASRFWVFIDDQNANCFPLP